MSYKIGSVKTVVADRQPPFGFIKGAKKDTYFRLADGVAVGTENGTVVVGTAGNRLTRQPKEGDELMYEAAEDDMGRRRASRWWFADDYRAAIQSCKRPLDLNELKRLLPQTQVTITNLVLWTKGDFKLVETEVRWIGNGFSVSGIFKLVHSGHKEPTPDQMKEENDLCAKEETGTIEAYGDIFEASPTKFTSTEALEIYNLLEDNSQAGNVTKISELKKIVLREESGSKALYENTYIVDPSVMKPTSELGQREGFDFNTTHKWLPCSRIRNCSFGKPDQAVAVVYPPTSKLLRPPPPVFGRRW